MEIRMSRCLFALTAAALWAGCNLDQGDGRERVAAAIECSGDHEPGSSKYCRAGCPCDEGEGDCDSDSECVAGLECRKDIGAHFGWDPEVDVCVAPCSPLGVDIDDLCTAECPCGDGVGDCDADTDCEPGGLCLKDAGAAYGYADPEVDVCVIGCPELGNGASNYCSTACPCDAGEGDCDGDDECAPGLECVEDAGAAYGFDPEVDVCEGTASTCADDEYECNDAAGTAAPLGIDYVYVHGADGTATFRVPAAQLCSNNEDWYLIPSDELPFQVSVIFLRARSLESGWCGAKYCGDVELPPAPENTFTVDFFDVTGSVHLGGWTTTVGLLKQNVYASAGMYSGGFLVRVSGPAAAQLDYEMALHLQTGDWEDECEC